MKIMMLACGDSIHTVRWANEYARLGHQVFVVANADHREKADKFSKKVTQIYLKHSGGLAYYRNAFEVRSVWKKLKPDVVNVCYASGYGTLARLSGIGPTVLSVWGSDVYLFPNKNFLCKRILTKNLRYADKVASTSRAMATQVRKVLDDQAFEITVTPFGISCDKFFPAKEEKKENEFIFGTVKKLTDTYGIDTVIYAFNEFLKMLSDEEKAKENIRLEICGKGDKIEAYRQIVTDLSLQDKVSIGGYVAHEQVPDLIRTFNVFCLGSRSESFGVSALEAMACGKPIIATDADGFKEVMIDKVTGFLVPIDDYKEMAEKMLVLYRNAALRKEMGENGISQVKSYYDWNENVKLMVNLLKRTAAENE